MSVVQQLGFASGERVVVIHVDDIGMCTAANEGALSALEGAATCGSVMVPCPAFDEIARIARERPELDLGVHLTLNAEHESYRWDPLNDDVPGLISHEGGMWRTMRETIDNASAEEVERELRAQVERALEAGIDVTHLDSHMGTVFDLKFVDVYLRLARDYRLPILILCIDREMLAARGILEGMQRYVEIVEEAEADGFPIFDHLDSNSLHFEPGSGDEHNRERLGSLGQGLSYLITHCARGGPELESITPDWRQRAEEQQLYSDGSMARFLDEQGIRTIGMRPLRDLMRAEGSG